MYLVFSFALHHSLCDVASQAAPALVPGAITFPLHVIVNPPQPEVPKVYQQGFHALLFASHYEAWGMPVMEVCVNCHLVIVASSQ